MDAKDAVADFIADHCDYDQSLTGGDDIFLIVRITGDDADDFMVRFADRFSVDMANYRWYFHHEEEGSNFGGLFFKSPDQRVDYIPITIDLLADAVREKRWPIEYPTFELPRARKDILINQSIVAICLLGLVVFLWERLVS